MRVSERYLPRQVFDQYVIIPCGQAVMDNKNVIKINEAGYVILKTLTEDIPLEVLVSQIGDIYGIEKDDINTFVSAMSRLGVIEA